ncbi:MAG: hypothetical protein ACRCX2_10570 [Paraclostridium sp.]
MENRANRVLYNKIMCKDKGYKPNELTDNYINWLIGSIYHKVDYAMNNLNMRRINPELNIDQHQEIIDKFLDLQWEVDYISNCQLRYNVYKEEFTLYFDYVINIVDSSATKSMGCVQYSWRRV